MLAGECCNGPTDPLTCDDVIDIRQVNNTRLNCGNGNEYTVWLSGGITYTAGSNMTFTQFSNGTAKLEGTIFGEGGTGFVDVIFTGFTSVDPTGSPKSNGCVNNNNANFTYYTSTFGTVTRANGNVLSISRRGEAFQIGVGANLQDANLLGASGWFDSEGGPHGDFNFRIGNTIPCDPSSANECTASGQITYEKYEGISGYTIANLTNHSSYPHNPTSSQLLNLFEAPVNVADYYGARISGYICAPETGYYTFWISGDDNSELRLSSDANPANASRIAYHTGWTHSRQWDKYGSQKSGLIYLVAGQKYYVEALMKEHAGGDNLAVGWELPSGTLQRPIPGTYLSPNTPEKCRGSL